MTRTPNPICRWVFDGEGIATRKYDGTCVKIEGDKYYKRREVKKGQPTPYGFIEEDFDEMTGKRVGWLEVNGNLPENRWHLEAYREYYPDSTYELVGPKINGNPEQFDAHILIRHRSADRYDDCPCTYDGLRLWLSQRDIEGIVWHHPDGRMAKIKKRDFGMKR